MSTRATYVRPWPLNYIFYMCKWNITSTSTTVHVYENKRKKMVHSIYYN